MMIKTALQQQRILLRRMEIARADRYGFLFRGLKSKYFYFRVLVFVVNAVVAMINVFFTDVAISLTLQGISFFLNAVFVIYAWPFVKLHTNLIVLTCGLASIGNILILLGFVGSNQTDGGQSQAETDIAIAFCVIFSVGFFGMLLYVMIKN